MLISDLNPIFKKYQFKKEMGRGANGITYLVEHNFLGTQSIVKLFSPTKRVKDAQRREKNY